MIFISFLLTTIYLPLYTNAAGFFFINEFVQALI